MINVDMIGDCYLGIMKDADAPGWLTDLIWDTASRIGYGTHFSAFGRQIEDDHVPFRQAEIPALLIIDFSYGGSLLVHRKTWHTAQDTMDKLCPESLQAVGDVLYHALPAVDAYLDTHAK